METIAIYNDSDNDTPSKRVLEKLVSDRDYHIYELINFYVITSGVCAFGVVANVMNIIVFWKQGFNNTMDISLLGLAISDLCSLMTMLAFNIFVSPLLDNLGVEMASTEMQHLSSGLPHLCFSRITSWITVFITAERCLCITLPLKIKQLITPKRTTMIVCAIYILIILSFEPEYETSYYDWKFDVKENKTLIGLIFRSNRNQVEGVTFIIFALLGCFSFITVIILTLVLVIQLNRKSTWRQNANVEKTRSELLSNRDRKTVTMVVMIATILIVCYTPGVIVSSVIFLVPDISVTGRYVNTYYTIWSFAVIFETFNSSINIFLYYHMSTKYRETFRRVCCWRTSN